MNSRWLYRAAGAVGLAGGFLLLSTGSAQAGGGESTDPELLDDLVGDVSAPTAGLPPLDLPVDAARVSDTLPTGDAATLLLDPHSGRLPSSAEPELLPGLPGLSGLSALPLTGLPGLDGAPLGMVPLDGIGLPGGMAGAGLPLADNDAAAAAPAGSLPAEVIGPALAGLAGDRTVGNLTQVGDIAGGIPLAGHVVSQTTDNLPLVGNIMPSERPGLPPPSLGDPPHVRSADPAAAAPDPAGGTEPSADPLGLTGEDAVEQLPSVIGDQLAAERGIAPEQLDQSVSPEVLDPVSMLNPALDPLGTLVGVGNLPSQVPLAGPLAGSALAGLPVIDDPAGATPAETPATADRTATAGERPVTADDPWWESAR